MSPVVNDNHFVFGVRVRGFGFLGSIRLFAVYFVCFDSSISSL